ncbi:MAG TPA: hypothetical protein VMC42_05730 [Methanoregulaceae archaeon]|nr:hypothetical protein [Methanoregulaceae archaeon]
MKGPAPDTISSRIYRSLWSGTVNYISRNNLLSRPVVQDSLDIAMESQGQSVAKPFRRYRPGQHNRFGNYKCMGLTILRDMIVIRP